jgi:hypothetical protein
MLLFSEFKAKQAKLITEHSKKRKLEEKQRQEQNEREYWKEYHDQSDEDHDWDREPNVKEDL